jgi:co-chaperonin GroES (HSP10)
MSIQAFGSKIIVKKEKEGEQLSGGILMLETAQHAECAKATVISVGAGMLSGVLGRRIENIDVIPGMIVYVNRFAGQKITYEREEYTVIVEDDIVALEK